MAIDRFGGKIYVANSISNSISVIDYKLGDTKIKDIFLGKVINKWFANRN